MGAQLAQYQNQGMSRDVTISAEQNNLAYENLNIRITTRGQETLLATTNEKGNKAITITDKLSSDGSSLSFVGTLIGSAVISNRLILFFTDTEYSSDSEDSDSNGPDYIYQVIHDNEADTWSGYLMVNTDLNFDVEHPIETHIDIEGDTVQKVYWVDGVNQLRMMNVIEEEIGETLQGKINENPTYFNAVMSFCVDPLLRYNITKSYDSISNFHSGTVQYAFTYSNKYGQETNIVNITDLQYLSYADRGADAESTVPCKFTIELSDVDTSFDYCNIYSIVTTSYNTTPAVYKVVELYINGSDTLSYVDDGSYDTSVATDEFQLLYSGGRAIVPYTLTAKDQVLFLGNYKVGTGDSDANEKYIKAIRTILRDGINGFTDGVYQSSYTDEGDTQGRPKAGINDNITFVIEVDASSTEGETANGTSHGITEIDYVGASGLYPYESQLKETSGKISVFKGGELYRFAVQFMDSTGALSQAFWIGDQWNDIYPSIDEENATISRAVANYSLPLSSSTTVTIDGEEQTVTLAQCLEALDYKVCSLMIAQASSSDRRVLAQGFLCPTMYNLEQRVNNTIWAIPSWYTRFRNGNVVAAHSEGSDVNTSKYCEIQSIDEAGSPYYDIEESEYEYASLKIAVYIAAKSADGWDNRSIQVVGTYYDSDGSVLKTITKDTGWAQKGSTIRKRMENDILSAVFNLVKSQYESELSTVYTYLNRRQLVDYSGISSNYSLVASFTITFGSVSYAALKEWMRKWRNQYFIDESLLTFHSPEITEDTAAQLDNIESKMRIVGIAEKTAVISDFTMSVSNPGSASEAYESSSNFNESNISDDPTGLVAYPLWHDAGLATYSAVVNIGGESDGNTITFDDSKNGTYFMVYPWHKEGSLQCLEDSDTGDKMSNLDSKTEANLHFSYYTKYLWASKGDAEIESTGGWVATNGISTLRSYWYDEPQVMQIKWGGEGHTYQGIYDYVLSAIVSSEDYSAGYNVYNTGLLEPDDVSYNNVLNPDSAKIGDDSLTSILDGYDMSDSGLLPVSRNAIHSMVDAYAEDYYGCVDPIRIAFKSTPHALFKLNPTEEGSEVILPSLTENESDDAFEDACYAWDVEDYILQGDIPELKYTFLSTSSDYVFDISSSDTLSGDEWDEVMAEVFDFNTTAYSSDSTDLLYGLTGKIGILVGTSESSYTPYMLSALTATTATEDDSEKDLKLNLSVYLWNVTVSEQEDSSVGVTVSGNIEIRVDYEDIVNDIAVTLYYYPSDMGGTTFFNLGEISITESTTEDTDSEDDSSDTSSAWKTGTFTISGGSFSNTVYAPSQDDTIGLVASVTFTEDYYNYVHTTSLSEDSDNKTVSALSSTSVVPIIQCAIQETVAIYYNEYTIKLASKPLTTTISDGCIAVFKIYSSKANGNVAKLTYTSGSYELDWDFTLPTTGLVQDVLSLPTGTEESDLNPYVFIAELYQDKDRDEYYGGVSDSAIENNTFIMAGKRTTIDDSGTTLIGTEGDAFFQRWDCLKTYPYSTDYTNSIVDIFSFMVETHQNIDGRYDNRRGLTENRNNNTSNFGLINKVYTQENNLITGSALDEATDEASYSSAITWTTAKVPMANVDNWVNITLLSSLPMDGRYGAVERLESNGSDIFCLQDKAVAKIRYNSNSAIAASDGVPIQLAMSGTVDGKSYATTAFGCQNKWSVCMIGNDMAFVDNINDEFVIVGASDYYNANSVKGLLSSNGFKDWLRDKDLGLTTWNPRDYGNFITFYDSINGEVYFLLKEDADDGYKTCLCYSTLLDKFESFYSYGGALMMKNIDDKFVSFADDRSESATPNILWEQGAGEYNSLFGNDYPYWISYRMAPNPMLDKTYGSIEYKADIFDMDRPTGEDSDEDWREGKGMLTPDTFDKLNVWNEYQWNEVSIDASTLMKGRYDQYPDIRKKFRTWRMDIPRDRKNKDNPYGLNRMRNPWLGLKLSKITDLDKHGRMEFHNMILKFWMA